MTVRMRAEEFQESLRQFVAAIPAEAADPVMRAVSMTALRKLIAKTPVDTGHARANWQVTTHAPAVGEVVNTDRVQVRAPASENGSGVSQSSAFKRGASAIRRMPSYSRVFITNNVEYIDILEDGRIEGGGFDALETPFGEILSPRKSRARGSIQAPSGMLGVTFAELVAGFEEEESDQ